MVLTRRALDGHASKHWLPNLFFLENSCHNGTAGSLVDVRSAAIVDTVLLDSLIRADEPRWLLEGCTESGCVPSKAGAPHPEALVQITLFTCRSL